MIGKYAAAVAMGALCLAGTASAKEAAVAQLSAVKGSVMISQNGKMAPAAAGALRAGDRVVVANGSARLAYADGCVVALKANGMATIGAASPCATGAGLVSASQGASAQTETFGIAEPYFTGLLALGAVAVVVAVTDEDSPQAVGSP